MIWLTLMMAYGIFLLYCIRTAEEMDDSTNRVSILLGSTPHN